MELMCSTACRALMEGKGDLRIEGGVSVCLEVDVQGCDSVVQGHASLNLDVLGEGVDGVVRPVVAHQGWHIPLQHPCLQHHKSQLGGVVWATDADQGWRVSLPRPCLHQHTSQLEGQAMRGWLMKAGMFPCTIHALHCESLVPDCFAVTIWANSWARLIVHQGLDHSRDWSHSLHKT